MEDLIIFTNNGIVVEFFEQQPHSLDVKWISAPASEVLVAAKGAVSKGRKLLSSPVAGVKTKMQLSFPQHGGGKQSKQVVDSINPYLSMLLSGTGKYMDFESARSIDEAMQLYKRATKLRFRKHSEDELQDFQAKDLETLLATIQYVSHAVLRNL